MNKIKGDNYENYILKYLIEIEKYDKAWLWKDLPEKILFEENIIQDYLSYSLVRNDIGIDIVAFKDNKYKYIQCKNYEETICIKDLAGYFFFKCYYNKDCSVYYNGKISSRLSNFNKNGEYVNIPFRNNSNESKEIQSDIKYEIRKYQIDAYEFLKDKQRGILSLPCGMGKTYISCILAKNHDNIIFFAPTKELCIQTFKIYEKYFGDHNVVLISSDGTRDQKKIKIENKNIFISTFKSCDIINKLIKKLKQVYIIIDEYHNLSMNDLTNKKNEFYDILYSKHKILFLSATPKYLSEKKIFGKAIYNYRWSDAIVNKYINDFEIYLPDDYYTSLDFNSFLQIFKFNTNNIVTNNHKLVKKTFFVLRSVLYNGNKKCIIYLSNTELATECSSIIDWMKILFNIKIYTGIIDYETKKIDRTNIINNFINSTDISIILNVHVLDEGIDIPACDSVFITNPSENIHNIVQRMSRCNRLYNGKDTSCIYLWCNKKKSEEILNYINNNTNSELINKIKKIELHTNKITNILSENTQQLSKPSKLLEQDILYNSKIKKYNCFECLYYTNDRSSWYNHKKSNMHLKLIKKNTNAQNNVKAKNTIATEYSVKNVTKYNCPTCVYETNDRSSWHYHKKSQKHMKLSENIHLTNNNDQIKLSYNKYEFELLKHKLEVSENNKKLIIEQLENTNKLLEEITNKYTELIDCTKRIEFHKENT